LSLNLGGIENLSLIPGTVGASPIQNIGAYGVELKDVFHSLSAFHLPSGEIHHFDAKACEFGYRDSIFKREKRGQYFIVSVQLKLSQNAEIKTQYGDIQATLDGWGIAKPTIHDISKAVIFIRESKLPNPAEIGNCGSFFKNPVVSSDIIPMLQSQYPDIKTFPAGEGLTKVPAGWLIEKAGWKGFRRDDVGVHAKQALVLVNYGNGSGQEIIDLAHEIQVDILTKFGIALEMEVNAW
jgi:UDP-N-acetylmuramate dehydrogenase